MKKSRLIEVYVSLLAACIKKVSLVNARTLFQMFVTARHVIFLGKTIPLCQFLPFHNFIIGPERLQKLCSLASFVLWLPKSFSTSRVMEITDSVIFTQCRRYFCTGSDIGYRTHRNKSESWHYQLDRCDCTPSTELVSGSLDRCLPARPPHIHTIFVLDSGAHSLWGEIWQTSLAVFTVKGFMKIFPIYIVLMLG